MVTSPGSIMVPSRIANRKLRIGNRKYAKANATIALEKVTAVAARKLIQKLLKSQCATGATLNRYCAFGSGRCGPVKFHDQWCGMSALSNVSPRGLNAALSSQMNGYRKRIASPISRRTKIPRVIQLAFGWGRQRRATTCGIGVVAPAVTNGGAFS